MNDVLGTLRIEADTDLIRVLRKLSTEDWWFRGHGDESWDLKTSLEREAERFGVNRDMLPERETTMLKLFSERMHLFDTSLGQGDIDDFEKHALLRHYGGPSRLLDVTSSILIAAFFAIHDGKPRKDAAAWAMSLGTYCTERHDSFDKFNDGVFVVKPKRLNARMNVQNGAFVVAKSLEKPLHQQIFEKLYADQRVKAEPYLIDDFEKDCSKNIWKLIIPHEKQDELYTFLSSCNIRPYTLFPGLEGLAESLKEMMRIAGVTQSKAQAS